MSDRFFLDTNIIVCSFAGADGKKQRIAQKLINDALQSGKGIVSSQVVQEFLHVALQKFAEPLTIQDAKTYLDTVLDPLCEIYPNPDFYKQGIDIHATTGYSLYDSLILAAAQTGNCGVLYSEDLQAGQTVGSTTIVNPFIGGGS
jgi:predicted nucleic acid-binding protein